MIRIVRALGIASMLCLFAGTARADTAGIPYLAIPGATVAVDPSDALGLNAARASLAFQPIGTFAYPGVASIFHPLVAWVRFGADPRWASGSRFLEVAPAVGRAELFYVPAGARDYTSLSFGMRQPFAHRSLRRIQPTIALPAIDPRRPLYLRLALDDESRLVPMASLIDRAQLRVQDASVARLADAALLFIGIFISLASANLFVFAFVREKSYAIYSGWMIANALFAATYMHDSAWNWLWPFASLPDAAVQGTVVILEAGFLIAFARAFLKTARLVPRADAIVCRICIALIAVGIAAFVWPSVHLGAGLTGRDVFLLAAITFVTAVFALAVVALFAGSVPARFFVASNAIVSLTAASIAVTNLSSHDVAHANDFLALMAGQSVEGWLLFGALAYRLRETTRAHMDEQQRRIVAQAESLAQARALLTQRQLAITDQLTGIANRRAFDDHLAREWDRCARSRLPLSLLMIDVDYFKLFNDAYGHVLGDDCLRGVARAIAGCVRRPGDEVARYGGEEFAVILAETDREGAFGVASEAIEAVAALRIPHRRSSLGYVTISVGVATLVPQKDAPPSIVEIADANLYRAKESGRNRFAGDDFVAASEPFVRSA